MFTLFGLCTPKAKTTRGTRLSIHEGLALRVSPREGANLEGDGWLQI